MGGDLPPAVLPSFMLGWGSSQARGVLPKGKGKLGIRKFLELATNETSQKFQRFEYMIWLAKVFGGVISFGSGQ